MALLERELPGDAPTAARHLRANDIQGRRACPSTDFGAGHARQQVRWNADIERAFALDALDEEIAKRAAVPGLVERARCASVFCCRSFMISVALCPFAHSRCVSGRNDPAPPDHRPPTRAKARLAARPS